MSIKFILIADPAKQSLRARDPGDLESEGELSGFGRTTPCTAGGVEDYTGSRSCCARSARAVGTGGMMHTDAPVSRVLLNSNALVW